jgi:hypothetical protein
MAVTGAHVEAAVVFMTDTLSPREDDDWSINAGPVAWSCWQTAAHVAHDLLAYAGQVAAAAQGGYLPADLCIRRETTPREVLNVVSACGRLLSSALTTANPAVLAWHWGPTDVSGFAALGVNEVLVHTFDISEGLGLPWNPPAALVEPVLARLFPGSLKAPLDQTLLWCTGRAELEGLARQDAWTVQAALTGE